MTRWIIGTALALLFLVGQFLFPQAATSPVLFSTNNLSDLASATTARTNLGLGTAATQNTGAFAQVANNLSDLNSASSSRTNLGLGTAAVQNVGTFFQVSNNLSEGTAASMRTNLGLGSAALISSTCSGTDLTGTLPGCTVQAIGGKTVTLANSFTTSGNFALTLTQTGTTNVILPTSGTVTATIASGSKALATSAISSATCTSAQTTTATGTLTTDAIQASFNGDPTGVTGYVPLTAGMLTIIVYPTADTVNFKVCNNTSSSITPGAVTLNWRVTR